MLTAMASPRYAEARDRLARFAELVKSPGHVHTYHITPLSIGNASAAGEKAEEIVRILRSLRRYLVPDHIAMEIVWTTVRVSGASPWRGKREGWCSTAATRGRRR